MTPPDTQGDTLTALRERYPDAETFAFDDTPDLCTRLLNVVCSGKKTATTGALRDFRDGEALPLLDRRDIALHWDGSPACVSETQDIITCPFQDVTEAMALAEGENPDLAGWQSDHTAYFTRTGGFAPDMMVVWERFKLIEIC